MIRKKRKLNKSKHKFSMKIKKVKIYWNWQIRRNRTNTMSQMCRNTMIVSRAVKRGLNMQKCVNAFVKKTRDTNWQKAGQTWGNCEGRRLKRGEIVANRIPSALSHRLQINSVTCNSDLLVTIYKRYRRFFFRKIRKLGAIVTRKISDFSFGYIT